MGKAAEILYSPSLWLGVIALAVLLIIGYVVLVKAKRLTDRPSTTPGNGSELDSYRQLRDNGELSEQEYEEICRQLSLRHEQGAGEPTSQVQPPTKVDSQRENPTDPN